MSFMVFYQKLPLGVEPSTPSQNQYAHLLRSNIICCGSACTLALSLCLHLHAMKFSALRLLNNNVVSSRIIRDNLFTNAGWVTHVENSGSHYSLVLYSLLQCSLPCNRSYTFVGFISVPTRQTSPITVLALSASNSV